VMDEEMGTLLTSWINSTACKVEIYGLVIRSINSVII
jgi:hypothetical protein